MMHSFVLGNGSTVEASDPATVWLGTSRGLGMQIELPIERVREILTEGKQTVRIYLAPANVPRVVKGIQP